MKDQYALNQQKYKGILFDLDGTLLDTANDLGAALNYILARHKLPKINKEEFRPLASDGAKGLIELGFSEQLDQFNYDDLRAEFLRFYQQNIAIHSCVYPGITRLIATLNEADIPWGIVTNKPIGLTLELLAKFPLFAKSHSIIGGDSLPQRKPHPAPLLHACKQLNIAPVECLFVGDAPRDIEAGNAANMDTVIAKWGYIKNVEQCNLWQANFIASSPKNISDIIL